MNLAIIGYGKMGRAIEEIAHERGHQVATIIRKGGFTASELKSADVAIEFTRPEAAANNIQTCFNANIPIVVGSTGWYDDYEKLKQIALRDKKTLFTASNFSLGVNIMFQINRKLAAMMNRFPEYEVKIEETHHREKKDHPSGTAISLAEDIILGLDRKKNYIGQLEGQKVELSAFDLQIVSRRKDNVPGFHQIKYQSDIDEVCLSHNAYNRRGFATGAVVAAEWIMGKTGVFGMTDLMN